MYKVIDPIDLDLAYTNIAANTEDEWSDLTTYDLDDLVQVTSQTPHKVFKSLRGNNINRFPPDYLEPVEITGTSSSSIAVGTGSKTFTTQAGLGFSVGQVVKIERTITPKTTNMTAEITAYNSGTGSMTVSVYSSTGSGTLTGWTIRSEEEIGFWEEVESTEQYKMIDEYVNTQSSNLDTINVRFNVTRSDYVSLFGVSARQVDINLYDATYTTLLWSTSIDMIYGSAILASISDWFEYFFGEYSLKEEVSQQIGYIIESAVLEIIIYSPIEYVSGTPEASHYAKCGNVVVGRCLEIGEPQYGAKAGLLDFSQKETDDDGRTKIIEGYWSKTNETTILIDNGQFDYIFKRLISLRAKPTAWIVTSKYEAFIVYGIYRDFSMLMEGYSYSWCNLEIEGLI